MKSGGVRWWPAVLVLVLGAARLVYVWLEAEATRQQRVVHSIAALVLVSFALVLWLLLLSRLRARTRFLWFGALALALGLFAAGFRVRGVTGDLVPILEPRWAAQEAPALPTPPRIAPRPTPLPTDAEPAAEEPKVASSAVKADDPEKTEPPAADTAPRADYPQFLGPDRNGVVRGVALARDWSAQPPRLLWRQPIGAGWSAFAVHGELAVTQEQRGDEELVVAYALRTGQLRWVHSDRARYETVIAGVGPRATPTIHDGRVYAVGATGLLSALDLATGDRLWQKNLLADNGADNPEWGKSCSPLALGGAVIVSAGGPEGRSLVAYDGASGQRIWSGGDDASAYSSPLVAELAGRRQVLILNRGSVAGHDPGTGTLLWEHPWPPRQPNVSQPLPLPPDRLLVSSGYGVGSKLLHIASAPDGTLAARLEWESPRLKAKFTNLVVHEGFVYGLDDGILVCLDPETGERRWKSGRYGHGQVLLVEGLLLVQTEQGEVVLVDPTPDAHRELTRFQALDGKTWNPPALAGRLLLVRNDREAAAYELPLAATASIERPLAAAR